ncbi:MAG: site-specific DNA-methyltransferase [Balneolaceae bacterium]|nr:site-specific DNA-methyltransferase [Balneolaceae bacterium]
MVEKSTHRIHFKNADNLSEVEDNSVSLVVTSPPYPMIEMWDESFSSQNNDIANTLETGKPEHAFELMHQILDEVWKECSRVLCDGGVACINIGDATRTIDKKFQLFSNHARIISSFVELGFSNLPNIIWRKQTNAPNKFMGSGMYPPGAYITLEHEFILVFRNGNKREFSAKEKQNRRESAYFWEERNNWFSDLWELKGTTQVLSENGARDRSGAYPFEIPYRLINMFSVKGDTILDPFIGTGTTSLAAIASGRNSIGYELESEFSSIIEQTLLSESNLELINNTIRKRILNHKEFVNQRIEEKGIESVKHYNEWFDFPVMTRQEKDLTLQFVENILKADDDVFNATYVQEALMDYQGSHTLFSQV